jgi:hypothetical protein
MGFRCFRASSLGPGGSAYWGQPGVVSGIADDRFGINLATLSKPGTNSYPTFRLIEAGPALMKKGAENPPLFGF